VVASGISNAKEYAAHLKAMGVNARIATSDDGPDAIKAIKAYKENRVNVLVSVNICYEGLDVPAISHIVCLTNIRSREWIEQMAGRAVRIDRNAGPYESQQAYVFAPRDPMFIEIKAQIEAEQLAATKHGQSAGKQAGSSEFALEAQEARPPGGIKPLSSALTGQKEVLLSGQLSDHDNPTMTSSEIETGLLEQIEAHIRTYSFQNRYTPKKINGEVFKCFGKKRREMTIAELKSCLAHVQATYPLSRIRGTGHPRVPTKATPYQCSRA